MHNATQTYPAIIKAIHQARSSIHWANFCFERGRVSKRLYPPLAAAARRGVAVRLLIDAYGSTDFNAAAINRWRQAGIEVVRFAPLQARRPWRYNHRLHKKLLIIDSTLGFTGGVGVGDFWSDPTDFPRSWRDTHFMISGPTVAAMQHAFVQSWNRFGPQLRLDDTKPVSGSRQISASPKRGEAIKMAPINSLPRGRQMTAIGRTFVALIDSAQRDITLTTAYFGPNRTVRAALQRAVQRGVRVRILANGPYVTHETARDAGRHLYPRLLRAGIQLYEYQPTKIHAKILVVDSRLCCIGSANLNFRSFYHDEEFNLVVRSRELAEQLNRDFEHDLGSAHEIRLDRWQQPRSTKLRQAGLSLGRYFF